MPQTNLYVPPYNQNIHAQLVMLDDHPLNRDNIDFATLDLDIKQKLMYEFNKHHAQKIQQLQDRDYELRLDQQLHGLLANHGLSLDDITIQHYSDQLNLIPKHNRRKLAYSNGFTLLIINHPNGKSYVSYSICHEDDNFNKLQGRVHAKRRLVESLVDNQNLSGLIEYDLLDKANALGIPEQRLIVSHFIKYKINAAYIKVPAVPVVYDEAVALKNALEVFRKDTGIIDDDVVIDAQFFHLRAYNHTNNTPTFVTRSFIKSGACEHNRIIEKGGISAIGIVTSKPGIDTKLVVVYYTVCRDTENFSKALGRQYALRSLVNDSQFNFAYESTITDDTLLFPEMVSAFNQIGIIVLTQ